ncbi:polysaccharide deacetylase family protein [Bacteroidota bacterium]
MLLARIPRLLSSIFTSFTWELPSDTKEVYLTFDDGPTLEVTEWVLNELDKYKAKATFFCLGNNASALPDVYSSILERGHAVGNHSFSHLKGFRTSVKGYVANVLKASEIIDSELFRPPYGRLRRMQTVLLRNRFKIVMWTVLSVDYNARLSGEQVVKNVIEHVNSGSIIVFHDSRKAEKNLRYALPKVLEYLSEHAYVMKKIDADSIP